MDEGVVESPKAKLKKGEELKIVTHHWGANWYKGFDTYQELDGLLSKPEYKDKISFTYIGNIPKKFKSKLQYALLAVKDNWTHYATTVKHIKGLNNNYLKIYLQIILVLHFIY